MAADKSYTVGTLGALNATAEISTEGLNSDEITVQLTGTWAGTVTFEVSVNGTNWVTAQALPSNSGTAVTTTTANGAWKFSYGAYPFYRLKMTAYTSGTATVSAYALRLAK